MINKTNKCTKKVLQNDFLFGILRIQNQFIVTKIGGIYE